MGGTAANPERGEHELVLAGRSYRLRPSHTAIVAIEEATGKAAITLYGLSGAGALPLRQMGIVAAEFIRAGAAEGDEMTRAVSAERIGELIYEEGVARVTARLTTCLMDAVSGGCTASGEAKAAPATSGTESAGAA